MQTVPATPNGLKVGCFYRHRNDAWSRVILAFGSWKLHGKDKTVAYHDVFPDGKIMGPSFCSRQAFVRACPNEIIDAEDALGLTGEQVGKLINDSIACQKALEIQATLDPSIITST